MIPESETIVSTKFSHTNVTIRPNVSKSNCSSADQRVEETFPVIFMYLQLRQTPAKRDILILANIDLEQKLAIFGPKWHVGPKW